MHVASVFIAAARLPAGVRSHGLSVDAAFSSRRHPQLRQRQHRRHQRSSAPGAKGWARSHFWQTCSKARRLCCWAGCWPRPSYPNGTSRCAGTGRLVCRSGPCVPDLAPLQGRQGRVDGLRRVSGRRTVRGFGGPSPFLRRSSPSPRYVSLASILARPVSPVFAWFTVRGERPIFLSPVQSAVSLLIIVKHHQNIHRLFTGRNPALEPKNPHEPHRRTRFRSLGNRHCHLA